MIRLKQLLSHKVFKNTIALLLMQVSIFIAPLLALPYLTRILGADGFGLFVTGLSLIILSNLITDFGFNLSSTYLISRRQNQTCYISKIISGVYLIKFILIAIAYTALAIYFIYSSEFSSLAILVIYITVFFQSFQSNWVFQGIEKMKFITYSTILARVSYLVFVFILVKSEEQYDVALLSYGLSIIISVLISNILIYREGFRFSFPSKRLVKLLISHSNQFFLSRVASSASSALSTLLVHKYSGAYQTGIYGASEKLLNAGRSLVAVINQAFYPYIARTQKIAFLFKFTFVLYLIAALPAIIIYIHAADLLILIFGDEYGAGASILRIFLFVGLLSIGTTLFGYPLFAGIKRVDIANKTIIYGGIIQITLLVILAIINSLTPINIAITILITEVFNFTSRIIIFTYLYRKRK